MNKKFFLNMTTIAFIILLIGIVATLVLACTTILVKDYYSRWSFNPPGLVSTLLTLIGTISAYYIIKGIALIGLKSYENEHTDTMSKKNGTVVNARERTELSVKNMKYGRIGIWVFIGIVIFAMIILLVYSFSN